MKPLSCWRYKIVIFLVVYCEDIVGKKELVNIPVGTFTSVYFNLSTKWERASSPASNRAYATGGAGGTLRLHNPATNCIRSFSLSKCVSREREGLFFCATRINRWKVLRRRWRISSKRKGLKCVSIAKRGSQSHTHEPGPMKTRVAQIDSHFCNRPRRPPVN